MPIVIPEGIPNRTKWCQICGKYAASPCDPLELRRMLAEKGVPEAEAKTGQAHPGCFRDLKAELGE